MIEHTVEARPVHPASPPTDTIVVGVAERLAGSERALWEAALWAARQHVDVTLLTAAGPGAAPGSHCPTPDRSRRDALHLIGAAAHRLARTADVDQHIHTTVVPGAAGAALITASAAASLLVLQCRDVGAVERLVRGSTTATVVGGAACPVLVVHDDDQTGLRRGLLVIIDTTASIDATLSAAFPEAMRRSRGITVLVLGPSSRTDDTERWSSAPSEERLNTWQRRFPRVPVTQVMINRFDSAALSRHAADCELLVVARRQSSGHGRSSLGRVTRRLLEAARCPVLVVPPPPCPLPNPGRPGPAVELTT